ncbi:MAG TPA: DMT family transporter [Jatrophihabitans sp.]|nr:DMT family transporter [Jatrophihabitans sp.]
MAVPWLVVGLSLGSALSFAGSTNLKHSSAGEMPEVPRMRAGALARFVSATLRHRLWLAGTVTDVIGLSLQILALHFGDLAMVQPLLISGLLFALLLRRRQGRPLTGHEVRWALVLTGCLVAFLFLVGAQPSGPDADGADRLPAAVAAGVGALLALACVGLAHRRKPAADAAALMGVAVGVVYAATAALLKAITDRAVLGPWALLTSWQLYTVIAVGAIGLLLNQLAFQAGPLTASLPAIATVDPLLSIVVGVLVYDEHIHRGPWSGAGLVVLMLLLGTAVIELGKVDVTGREPSAVPKAEPQSRLQEQQPDGSGRTTVPLWRS